MKLQIGRQHIEAMILAFPRLGFVEEQLRFGNRVELGFGELSDAELDFLHARYLEGGPEERARGAQIATLQKALRAGGRRFEPEELEMAVPAIARYLSEESARGWLFSAGITGKPLAYVVTRLDFTPPSEEETGKIFIELKANAKARLATATLRIAGPDIAGRTIPEILAARGFVKETPELLQRYDETAARYFDWRSQYGAQFGGSGVGYFAENPTATHRDTDYARKDVVILSSTEQPARLVNDENILGERVLALDATGNIMAKFARRVARTPRLSGKEETEVEDAQADIPKGLFTELPVHFYMLMFHLDLHHYVWVHVDDMAPYAYQPALKQKLIYIKKRDDNITMNAVVGVFLRVLEYFNGLLFLTTNRVDDIDEAIVSRCIALIKFHPPGREDRRKIWEVMTEQFALPLDAALREQLPDLFPEATGRDIKGLTKLVAKYCRHKQVPPSIEVFRRCSIFRGMELAA